MKGKDRMSFVENYLRELKKTLDKLPSSQIEKIKDILLEAHRKDKKVFSRVVFLDRDGVICRDRDDYVKSWDEFVWIPGAKEALKCLNDNHYMTIVVTNQAGVARGITSQQAVEDIHRRMTKSVSQTGGKIEAVYYCPHKPEDKCDYRKPKAGLLLKAAKDFAFNPKKSYLVGDKISDIETGQRVGCTTIMIKNGENRGDTTGKNRADYTASDLAEAVDLILKLDSASR